MQLIDVPVDEISAKAVQWHVLHRGGRGSGGEERIVGMGTTGGCGESV